jgi:hypothetical protein
MKTTKILTALITSIVCMQVLSCSKTDFGELSKKQIYMVGSGALIGRETSFEQTTSDASLSVYCSGMENTKQAVQVELYIDPTEIDRYNSKLSASDQHLTLLPTSNYAVSSYNVEIPAGSPYGLLHFKIITTGLDGNNVYALPVRIKSVSAHEVNPKMDIALYKLDLVNKYSGAYRMSGQIDGAAMSAIKNLKAISPSEAQIYADTKSEILANKDYQITIKIQEDNRITLQSKKLKLTNTEQSNFDPLTGEVHLFYEYEDPVNGQIRKVKESMVRDDDDEQ